MKNILLLTAVMALSFTAQAKTITFVATLNGPSEAPPNTSPGTGTAIVTYNDTLRTLRVQVSYTGLEAEVRAAHIHAPTEIAFAGTAGVATRTPSFLNFPSTMSGTYDHTYDLTDAGSYRAGFITANGGTVASAELALKNYLLAGNAYLNIHSVIYPGGEIRGFLIPQDSDNDLVPDYMDAFPNSRDVGSTVKVGSCDTGIANKVVEDGATISDLIYELGTGVRNHGQFVSRIAKLKSQLISEGVISSAEGAAIQSCAARTKQL